jgi:hypothetical protein
LNGFCIVSSDSDFTQQRAYSHWNGMKQKPNSFIVACDRFIYIEVLDGAMEEETKRESYTNTKNYY